MTKGKILTEVKKFTVNSKNCQIIVLNIKINSGWEISKENWGLHPEMRLTSKYIFPYDMCIFMLVLFQHFFVYKLLVLTTCDVSRFFLTTSADQPFSLMSKRSELKIIFKHSVLSMIEYNVEMKDSYIIQLISRAKFCNTCTCVLLYSRTVL